MTSPQKSSAPNLQLIQTDPDILETRVGGGCLMLFGLPFLLAGLFVIAASVKLIPIQGNLPWYFGIPFGAIFAAAGAALMFGRTGMTIDRRQKTILKWWGLLAPMKRTEYPLDQYSRVTLGRESRSSGDSTTIVFPVKLEGAGSTPAIEIEAPQLYPAGRQLAEKLARFLNRPLVDTSSGQAIAREPDQLDESLRDQARQTPAKTDWAELPYGSKIEIHDELGAKVFVLPPPGLTFTSYLQMLMALVFASLVTFFFVIPLTQLPMPAPLRYLFLGFIGTFFILAPILSGARALISSARKRVRVLVSREFLRVEDPGLFRKKAAQIPAAELEELVLPEVDLSPLLVQKLPDGTTLPQSQRMMAAGNFLSKLTRTAGITARSDKATLEFGQGLSKDELRYLQTEIKRIIAE